MLLVLTGQLTLNSLDDACMKEQVLYRACDQIVHCTYTLKCYNIQYGIMTTKTLTKLPTSSEVLGTEVRLQLSTLYHRGESHYTLGTNTLMNTVGLVSYFL